MNRSPDGAVLSQTVDWAWEKALEGLPGMDSAEELAGPAPTDKAQAEARIDALIASQKRLAFSSGLLTGLTGAALPLAVPASLALGLFLKLRLVAAIAILRGYDLDAPGAKAVCAACLCGSPVPDLLREAGVDFGPGVTSRGMASLMPSLADAVARQVRNTLTAKLGAKGLAGFGKALPLIGGLFGGLAESASIKAAGRRAREALR